jgi:hypothetical protein
MYEVEAHGYQVRLHAAPWLVQRLTALASPWLDIRPVPSSAVNLQDGLPLVVAAEAGCPTGLPSWEASEDDEPLRRLCIDTAAKTIHVVVEDPDWATLQTLRTLRNLLRWRALSSDGVCVHGAMVCIAGRGIAVLGRKKAGKTTTALVLMALHGAGFVSNDDLTLLPTATGWCGVGWPRSVNIRQDAVDRLAGICPELGGLRAASTHPAASADAAGEDFSIPPLDLCRALGVTAVAGAPLSAIVLPRFADGAGASLARLDPAVAAELLVENVDSVATDHDEYLLDWFTPSTPQELCKHAENLAATIPCYTLRQDMADMRVGAAVIVDLARSLPADLRTAQVRSAR